MKTATEFKARLIELQNEQRLLLSTSSRRIKSTRLRVQEITKEFFKVKQEWRETLGRTMEY